MNGVVLLVGGLLLVAVIKLIMDFISVVLICLYINMLLLLENLNLVIIVIIL